MAVMKSNEAHLNLLKALAHPMRLKILGTLSCRETSPAEFAREHGLQVSNVAYHFRRLCELGVAEVTDVKPARGSTEHFHRSIRPVVFEDDVSREMPDEMQRVITQTIFQDLVGRISQAIVAETFDARKDRHFTWTPMVLDEQGWNEAMSILASTFSQLAAVEEKAGTRLAKGSGDRLAATMALVGFESPMGEGR